jgi:oxygen-independent coproporphyrinogen III oxidase
LPEERARERVMLGLRRCQGIDLAEFREQTGFDFRELAPESLTRHLRQGFVEEVDGRVRLTCEGRFVADTVIADFL